MFSRLKSLPEHRHVRQIAGGILVFLCLAPCVPVLTQILTLAAAHALTVLAEVLLAVVVPRLPLDPVYAHALVYNISHIDPHGLAVAGPVGSSLHQQWPHVFESSEYVQDGAMASAVIERGSTVAASILARVAAAIPLLCAVILVASLRGSPRWLQITCLLVEAQVLLDLAPEVALVRTEIEAAGIPFLVAAFLPVSENGQRVFFTRGLDGVPDWAVSAVAAVLFSAATLVVAYSTVAVVRCSARAIAGRFKRASHQGDDHPARSLTWRVSAASSIAAAVFVLGMAGTPLRVLSESEPVFVDQDAPVEEPSEPPLVAAEPESQAASATGPSVVKLERSGDQFSLRVNGAPTVVKGIGYNPWYAELDVARRRELYERDFSMIADTGANMLEGWFEQQFDEVTLDAAHAHGLGVIMPFELNQDYDYGDPAVQERFLEQISAWVIRYRGHPAVRMWAPGNEVLHRLIYPTMVRGAVDPAMELRAEDYAAFYVRIIDRIHELDPDHPVLYRDAEDGYIGRLAAALKRDGRARPWLIYGANAYTPRIEQIVRNWSAETLGAPIIFSEFSPSGLSAQDKAFSFHWFWKVIRSRPSMVLGGVVYTWSRVGPEDLDRVFGLTDGAGQPVDDSVAALTRLFHCERIVRCPYDASASRSRTNVGS
jgi:hypothetical protein